MSETEWQIIEARVAYLLEWIDAINKVAPACFLAAIIGATIIGGYWY